MLETIRDHYYSTGRKIGMKPAGGVRTAKQALQYLVLVKETLGDGWLTPSLPCILDQPPRLGHGALETLLHTITLHDPATDLSTSI